MPALSAEVCLAWIYLGGISPAPSKCAIIARSIEKQVVAPPPDDGGSFAQTEQEMNGAWIHAWMSSIGDYKIEDELTFSKALFCI